MNRSSLYLSGFSLTSSPLPLLTCPALGVPHGFSTRLGGVSEGIFATLDLGAEAGPFGTGASGVSQHVLLNRRRFAEALGFPANRLICAKQVHGREILSVSLDGAGKIRAVRAGDASGGFSHGDSVCEESALNGGGGQNLPSDSPLSESGGRGLPSDSPLSGNCGRGLPSDSPVSGCGGRGLPSNSPLSESGGRNLPSDSPLSESGGDRPPSGGESGAGFVCDGFVSATPGLLLAVKTADCVPILFSDRAAGVVGAAHAGWRGTVAGVAASCLAAMVSLGARPERTVAAIGPCIHPCCYEVDDPFVAAVSASSFSSLCLPHILRTGAGRYTADLPAMNRSILLACGLREENLFTSGFCTGSSCALFFSHRATGGKRGLMMAGIGLL